MRMPRTVVLLAATGLSAGLIAAARGAVPPGGPEQELDCATAGAPVALSGKSCAPLAPPRLACSLPADVEGEGRQANLNVRQRAADLFSWQELIALSWPAAAGQRGRPDAARRLGDPGPRVWETWKEEQEVFLPRGARPPGWDEPSSLPLPPACRGASKLLFREEKTDLGLDSVIQAAAADGTLPATLTDQKGNVVRYEIRLNRTMFDFILANKLYDGAVQAQAESLDAPPGAVLIKAAWREVAPAEEAGYEVADACLCEVPAPLPGAAEGGPHLPALPAPTANTAGCRPARVGLVGLHISQKTPSAPQWIWSTFEQASNLTSAGGAAPAFFDPLCNPLKCPVNRQTAPHVPNQLARVLPIPSSDPVCERADAAIDNIRQLNDDLSRALSVTGSALAHYRLIGTQWPLPSPPADPRHRGTVFDVRPALLANTTMESFVQDTSSCMGCHASARTTSSDRFVSADFSFTLSHAEPRPAREVLGPPMDPETTWDREHWSEIKKGSRIAADTYRLLPGFVGAKLHCASCHLESGGDPSAAWWVGMRRVYASDKALADRINQCFERSLNGKELCTTSGEKGKADCGRSPEMQALLSYMDWLSEQWHARHGDAVPPRGFPALPALHGEAERGAALYVQKCAVCHGAGGQGRYEHDSYFRPALWGPASFNACAGSAQVATLASFVAGTMPQAAGGALVAQEGWDVAAFIDAQCRPGKGRDARGRVCPLSAGCRDGKPVRDGKLFIDQPQLPPEAPE